MKVGSVVECINDVFNEKQKMGIPCLPKRSTFYMVRSIEEYANKKIGIRLEEVINPALVKIGNELVEPTFDIDRFREVEELDLMIEELLEESLCELY